MIFSKVQPIQVEFIALWFAWRQKSAKNIRIQKVFKGFFVREKLKQGRETKSRIDKVQVNILLQ